MLQYQRENIIFANAKRENWSFMMNVFPITLFDTCCVFAHKIISTSRISPSFTKKILFYSPWHTCSFFFCFSTSSMRKESWKWDSTQVYRVSFYSIRVWFFSLRFFLPCVRWRAIKSEKEREERKVKMIFFH